MFVFCITSSCNAPDLPILITGSRLPAFLSEDWPGDIVDLVQGSEGFSVPVASKWENVLSAGWYRISIFLTR